MGDTEQILAARIDRLDKRITVALATDEEVVAAMQAEIDELREVLDALVVFVNEQVPEPPDETPSAIQYVRELKPPPPISEPLDVFALADKVNELHAAYFEAGDVYSGYL